MKSSKPEEHEIQNTHYFTSKQAVHVIDVTPLLHHGIDLGNIVHHKGHLGGAVEIGTLALGLIAIIEVAQGVVVHGRNVGAVRVPIVGDIQHAVGRGVGGLWVERTVRRLQKNKLNKGIMNKVLIISKGKCCCYFAHQMVMKEQKKHKIRIKHAVCRTWIGREWWWLAKGSQD